MTTSIPFARGLVLVGVTAVWLFPWQVVAAQSCTTFDPPCPVDQPPGVTVSPGGGTYGTPSVRVSIFFSDDYGLNWGSVTINPNVFGPDPGASGSSGSYSGTVQLQAGTTTTLTASICDYAGHCTSTSANFTYSTSPPPPTHVAPWVSIAVYDDDNRDASRCVANCFEQTLSYATPAYTSLDIPHSVALFYSAAQVLPEAIVAVDAYDGSSAPPASMSLKLQRADFSYLPLEGVPGTPTPNEIFFQSGSGWSRVGARFNTGSLTTGAYYYTAVVTSYWADASLASTMPVRVLIIREAQSPYGIGWSIAGLQRLIVQSDGAVVTNGDGSIAFFSGCTTLGSTCGSPSGDFTTLTRRADGSGWDRRWLDGTTAAFDANGRQVSVADRYGNQTAFAYNGAGALASITDAAGLVTSLAYDASGKLQSIRDPASRVTQVTVNASGDLTEISDPDGVRALQVVYDGAHLPLYTVDRVGGRSDFTRDFAGKLSQVQLATVTANGQQVRPTRKFRAIEQQVLLDGSGLGTSGSPAPRRLPDALRAKITEPNGDSTVYAQDRFGQPTRIEFRNPQGQWRSTVVGYTMDGQVGSVVTAENESFVYGWSGPDLGSVIDLNTNSHTDLSYESSYHQLKTVAVDGTLVQENFYGTLGRLDSTKVGTSKTSYTYDGRGRVLTVNDPLGHQTTFTYDGTGAQNTHSVTAPDANGVPRATTYAYDGVGRVQSVTDATNRVFTAAYDAINRVTSTSGPLSTITQFGYDDATRHYTVTDAKGQVYQTARNALGWGETQTDPAGALEHFAYDSSGNLIAYTNRRGGVVTSTFDALNRPLTVTADGQTTTFAYDATNYWVAIANGESTDTVKWDAKGRVTDAITWRSGVRYLLQPTYTREDLRNSLKIVAPTWTRDVGYGYDALFRLNYLRNQGTQAASITYTSEQLPNSVTLPINLDGTTKLTETFTYNARHLPLALSYNWAPQPTVGRRYMYDALGRTVTATRGTPQSFDPMVFQEEVQRTLTYDVLGRLSHYDDRQNWQEQGQLVCPDPFDFTSCYYEKINHSDLLRQQDFTYDAVGNRTDLGAVTQIGNRVTTFNGYTLAYDADGNLTSKTKSGFTQTLTWNARGQLTQVTTNGTIATFGYDGFGRRVRKTVGGATTRYVWDGDDLVMELDAAGSPLREYSHYPGVDEPFAVRRSSDGAMFYYAEERPGHVVGLISTADQVVNGYEYDPWGQTLSSTEQVPQPLRYEAREYDSETGLYYVRARYYDPQVARFISEDPIGLAGGINPYVYGGDDPVNRRDPRGLDCYYVEVSINGVVQGGEWQGSTCGGGSDWDGGVGGTVVGPGSIAAATEQPQSLAKPSPFRACTDRARDFWHSTILYAPDRAIDQLSAHVLSDLDLPEAFGSVLVSRSSVGLGKAGLYPYSFPGTAVGALGRVLGAAGAIHLAAKIGVAIGSAISCGLDSDSY